MYSPLLFPVRLEERKLLVLDETSLPFKEEYLKVEKLEDALDILAKMKTRALGQVLLFFYSAVLFQKEISPEELARKFKEIRPTFDFELLGQILNKQAKSGITLEEAVKKFIQVLEQKRKARAKELAKDLPSKANILTICNVSGELVYLFEALKNMAKEAIFYVSETRPYLQGTRLTLWELRKNKIPSILICDNQVASLMQDKIINCVVVGSDRSTVNGDIINKIGTYTLARLAKYFGIPFYVLTQYPQDIDIDTIEIEERPENEVFMFLEGVGSLEYEAVYPSFDITKKEFITKTYEIKAN